MVETTSGQNWSRKRTQRCIQKFDWYANPVSMTYNQQKQFTTVNGAVCTCFSWILLLYLIGIAVTNYIVQPTFHNTFIKSSVVDYDPGTYEIEQNEMMVMSLITDSSGTIPANEIDTYASGVYIQTLESSTEEPNIIYSLPVPCQDLSPELFLND